MGVDVLAFVRKIFGIRTTNEPAERPILVDVTDTQLMGLTSKNVDIESTSRSQYYNQVHKILWYNLPAWLSIRRMNELAKSCRFNNCEHTANRGVLNSSSAIIFCIGDCSSLNQPPLYAHERPTNQVWIYFRMESPATQERNYKGQIAGLISSWMNSFNWSMSYQLDSDIVFPYGVLTTKQFVENRNFSEIFRRKSKWAAWLVSKCNVPSLRDKFVDKLKKHGLPVDIFGRCGKRLTTDPETKINGEYKFYLSFENSMCEDYVTEKFFRYFRYDTILVVRGGADYKKLLPKDTFIDTADFKSFKSLVDYLKLVGNNEILYTTYLRKKASYTSDWELKDINQPYCALCNKLNNVDIYKKIYTQIPKDLQKCYTPGDIDRLEHPDDLTSPKHLRTKVTPDLHKTYIKNGGNLGSESN